MTRAVAFSLGIFGFLGLGYAFWAPQASDTAPKESVYSDAEGYAILSLILDQETSKARLSTIDISTLTTSGREVVLDSEKCLKVPEEFQSALKAFQEKNKSKLRLAAQFSITAKYKLSEKPDVQSPPQAPGEQQLEETFVARVFYSVSAVGFDQDKTHAVAYVSAYCGVMCAGGAYHLLIKDKQGWKEIPESPKCQWVSQRRDSTSPWGTS